MSRDVCSFCLMADVVYGVVVSGEHLMFSAAGLRTFEWSI